MFINGFLLLIVKHFQIPHGSVQRFMTKKLSEGINIDAGFEAINSECMTKWLHTMVRPTWNDCCNVRNYGHQHDDVRRGNPGQIS